MPNNDKIDEVLTISKTFLPRRSDTATMQAHKAGIILSKGELFLEYPNSGPGTKGQYYFKVGDGVTPYKDLPYAFGNISENFLKFTDITYNEGDKYTFQDAMDAIVSGASFGDIISNIKFALKYTQNSFNEHAEDSGIHLQEGERDKWNVVSESKKVDSGSLNALREPGRTYYADSGNACTDKPDNNKVDAFGMRVFTTSTGHVCQILTEDGGDKSGRMFVRIWNGAAFTRWAQLFTSADPPSQVELAKKAQNDVLGQKIDTTYIKNLNQKATTRYTNLAHSDKQRIVNHEFTFAKGNNAETKFNFDDENTQYQMHVKNASNADGNVKVELTSTDNTSNTVTFKGDGKGSRVTSANDVVSVNTDYQLSIENANKDGRQNGVNIVLTDINGNRKVVTLRSDDETEVYAVSGNEINFYIPNVAIERLVKVPDEATRFSLTRDDVQNGDSVLQLDTKIMYIVTDDENLYNSSGYTEYSAQRATELTTPRKIDGVEFSGKGDIIHYGLCGTAAGTAAKAVSVNNFKLVSGARVIVKFSATNTVDNPTLNVSGTGAKNIRYGNANIRKGLLRAGYTYEFVYDGTYYNMVAGKITDAFASEGVYDYGDSDMSHYCTCGTAAGTAAKTVTVNNFKLYTGARVIVKFTVTDTAGSCTLNVSNTGAKNIRLGGANIRARQLQANYTYEFVFDGSYWELMSGRCLYFDGGDEG